MLHNRVTKKNILHSWRATTTEFKVHESCAAAINLWMTTPGHVSQAIVPPPFHGFCTLIMSFFLLWVNTSCMLTWMPCWGLMFGYQIWLIARLGLTKVMHGICETSPHFGELHVNDTYCACPRYRLSSDLYLRHVKPQVVWQSLDIHKCWAFLAGSPCCVVHLPAAINRQPWLPIQSGCLMRMWLFAAWAWCRKL